MRNKNCNECGIAPLCTEKQSLCDTCRKVFVCPMQHIEHREKCGLYEPLPNPIEDLINAYPLCETCKKIWKCPEKSDNYKMEKTSCGSYEPLFKFKEEIKMEAPELVEKPQAEIAKNAWKDRLKKEYAQLKERYEKLKAYNNKKEVESYLMGDCIMKQEEYHNNRLLKEQQHVMGEYLHILELRAELAHIEL